MIRLKLTIVFLTLILCCGCNQKTSEKLSHVAPQATLIPAKPSPPVKPRTKEEELTRRLENAAHWGATKEVKSLLAQGANPNVPGKNYGYPLSRAIFIRFHKGHYETIRVLLEHGANSNQIERDSFSPLEMALSGTESGQVDAPVVRLLLEYGANVNQIVTRKNYPGSPLSGRFPIIFLAAVESEGEAITAMAAKGANVNARDIRKRTPLMLAIAWENETMEDEKIVNYLIGRYEVEVVKALLKAGADVNARDAKGQTPLIRTLSATADELKDKTRMFQVVQALLQNGAKVDAAALKLARSKNYQQTVALLLSHQRNRAR